MSIAIFCITLKPENEKFIKDLSYIPVGLGDKKFSKIFLQISQVQISQIKILFMVNILFIIGYGKTI